MRQAIASVVGMTRSEDPITSVLAAATVSRRKWTLRQKVEYFARRCPHGFIDEEAGMLDPDGPESSIRKRRTELTAERIIIASEETRRNSHGQPATVFYHRLHVSNPPPLKPREKKPSRFTALQEEVARLRAEVAAERAAVVAYLREIGDGDDDMHTWRYCQDMLAITFERGEHRR